MDRRGLGDQDDVDPGAGEGVEQPGGEPRDADHAAAFQRDQGDVVGIGDAQDILRSLRGIFLHQGTPTLRIEGIPHIDRNPLFHDGLDGRRINDFRPEVGQFLGGTVGDVPDGPGGRDNLGIGGHNARDVGPDLHQAGTDAHGQQRCGVVRAATAEGADPALRIRGDEARHDEQRGMSVHDLPHVPVRDFLVDMAVGHTDDLPGIQPLAADAQGGELCEDDLRREQLPVTLDGIQAGRAELAQQENPAHGVAQFPEQAVYHRRNLLLEDRRKQFPDDGMMPVLQFLQQGQAAFVTVRRPAADFDQGVGTAADGGTDDDGPVLFQGLGDDAGDPADGGSGSDGRAAEFQYLHTLSRMGWRMAVSWSFSSRKPS